jgi:hypothetical protein
MVDLPRGDVSETRRGGVGVLELLLVDMQKREESGYIRCEAGALGGAVGQITVRSGTPSMVLFESADGNLLIGQTAVGALQEAASLEGSQLTRHTGVDLDLIEDLHPLARLHLDDGETLPWSQDSEAEAWWRQRQRSRRQWKKLDAWTPDDDTEQTESVIELPPLPFHPGSEIMPGMVAMVDTSSPHESMKMAAHLGLIGHPLLVISRLPPERLESEIGLPEGVTAWLTEKGSGDTVLKASLEEVRRSVDDFLFGSSRACIVLDGIEFLSGIHGFDRMMELIRSIVDQITTSDHLLLVPADLDVWDERQRSILLREVDLLDPSRVYDWSERPARLEGHPFCSDDWSAIEVPPPMKVESPVPVEEPIELQHEANRYSISGLVDEWREERHAEVSEVAQSVSDNSESSTDESLPEWATAPSANRELESIPETNEIIPGDIEVIDEVVESPTIIPDPEPLPEIAKGPKSATINHRGTVSRRVRRVKRVGDEPRLVIGQGVEVGELPSSDDPNRLPREGLALAASKAIDVEAKVVLPEEVVQYQDGLNSAASNARLILGDFEGNDQIDMRAIGMNAAKRAASGSDLEDQAPPLTTNSAVREASSRAQRTLHLTGRLADSEKASIRMLNSTFSGSGGDELTIWQRLKVLEEKGIDIQHIVDEFDTNPDAALIALKEAEK